MSGASALEAVLRCAATVEVAESLDQVRDDVRRFCAGLGYDRFMLFSTSPGQSEPVERIYWLEGDWFGTGEAVDAKTYMQRCPVTRHVVTAREPFFWTKTRHAADGELYRIVTTPRGPGIHGLQVPLFGPLGLEGAMSLGGARIDASVQARWAVKVVAEAAFLAARRLLAPPPEVAPGQLSTREREVLAWIAAGRRQGDIAATLALSERTVENHLRRIRKRLEVKTTAEAIRVAIRNGEIGA